MTIVAEVSPSAAAAREASLRSGTVFWAWLHGEDVRAAFMSSVIAMLTSDNAALLGSFLDQPSGPNLSVTRNAAASALMASQQEWLWFTDSDTVFGPETLPALLRLADPARRPILAAAVPVVAHDPGMHPVGEWPSLHWAAYTDHFGQLIPWSVKTPMDPVQKVAAVGTGCVLIHRSAFEAVGPAPFSEETDDGISYGEDLSFCRKAARAGVPIHVASEVRVGHAKVVTL